MSQSVGVLDITFKAAGDLSAKQYHFVKLDTDGKVEACGHNEVSVGILQNAPDAEDKAARVRLLGTSKLVMNEAVDEGEMITSTADGDGEVIDAADEYAGAIDIEAATAQDDIVEVLIIHTYSPVSHAA